MKAFLIVLLAFCIEATSPSKALSINLSLSYESIKQRSDSLIDQGLFSQNIIELNQHLNTFYQEPNKWKSRAIPIFNDLVRSYGELRDFENCLLTLKSQSKWMRIYGGTYLDFGKLYHNYAKLMYYKQKMPEAIFFNKIALALKILHKPVNYRSVIITYRELGECYSEIFESQKAKACFTKCLTINNKIKDSDPDFNYQLVEKYVMVLYEEGNFEAIKAILINSLSDKYTSDYSRVMNNISAYQHLAEFSCKPQKEYDKAIYYLHNAIALKDKYQMDSYFDPVIFKLSEAGIYYEKSDYKKTKELYLSSLTILNKISNYDKSIKSKLYNNLFQCCMDLHDYENAKKYLIEYSKLKYHSGNKISYIKTELLLNQLWIDVNTKKQINGLSKLREILKQVNLDLQNPLLFTDYFNIPSLESYLIISRSILESLAKLNKGIEVKELSLSLTLNIIKYYEYKNSLNANLALNVNSIGNDEVNIKKGIDLAFDLYTMTNKEEYIYSALQLIEKNKTNQLTRAIRSAFNFNIPGLPDNLRIKKEELNNKIRLLLSQESNDLSNINNQDKYVLLNAYSKLLNQLAGKYPKYFKLEYGEGLFKVDEFNSKYSDDNTSYLNYFYTDSCIFTILIQDGTNQFKRLLLNNSEISKGDQEIKDFISIVSNKPKSEDTIQTKEFLITGIQVYNKLIKPIEKYLLPKLIISSNGILNNLSFEVIPMYQNSLSASWKDINYMLNKYTISYTNSLSVYKEIKDLKSSAFNNTFLGISYSPQFVHNKINNSIPYVDKEIDDINKILPGKLLTGKEATKELMLTEAAKSKILHIASHAIVDSLNGNQSYLILASSKSNNPDKLFAYELYPYKLNNDLVVLSSCESGTGKNLSGEGVIGLTRSFFYTGARCILPSLWNVSDYQSSQILASFYKEIKKGSPYNEALREAKSKYINSTTGEFAHPFYWGEFILIGNPGNLEIKVNYNNYFIWSLIALIGLVVYKVKRQRRKAKTTLK